MYRNLSTSKSILFKFVILTIILAANTVAALASDVEALKAQRQVVTEHLRNGQVGRAKAALSELQQKYSSLPEYPKQFHELGWEFLKRGYYATALQMYQDLQKQFPEHERAVWFQRSIILAYLEQEDIAKALEAVEQMKNNSQLHPDYINQIEKTMSMLIEKNQPAAAKELSEFLLEKFPEHPRAVWFQHYKARSEISMKQQEAADADVEVMRQKYNADPDYASVLSWTAYNYREAGFYERSIKLNESVLALNPDKKIQLRCVAGIARSYVRLGNDAQAQEKVNYLLANFGDNPQGLAFYLLGVLEDYYEMGQAKEDEEEAKMFFQKAVQIAELRLSKYSNVKLSNPDDDAGFYNCLGDCYRRTGQYQKAVDCFEKVINNFPDYDLAWHVQFQIGRCYRQMAQDNLISEEEAIPKIKAVYEKIIANYPDCKAAKAAQSWLERN